MDRRTAFGAYHAAHRGCDCGPLEIEMGQAEAVHGCWVRCRRGLSACFGVDFGDCGDIYE